MKHTKTLLKILVSLAFFLVIFSKVDINLVAKNIALIDLRYLLLLILLIVSNYIVSSYRWKKLLIHNNTEMISVAYLTSLYFVGSFFNNFLPTSMGGDVYKVYALGKKIKNNTDAFTATFMERFTGVVALVLISYFGLFNVMPILINELPYAFKNNLLFITIFKLVLILGFWIILVCVVYLFKYFAKKTAFIKKLYESFLVYKGKNDVLLSAFITSLVVQFIAISTQYFVFKAMGIDLPIWYSLFTFPIITLLGFFIPSLNGLGIQDALYMQLFLYIGVATEVSLSASIIYHLLRLFVSLFGGVIYVFNKTD